MKAKPVKMGSPGKVGAMAGKSGKAKLPVTTSLQKLDKPTVGSALGLLGKHFK